MKRPFKKNNVWNGYWLLILMNTNWGSELVSYWLFVVWTPFSNQPVHDKTVIFYIIKWLLNVWTAFYWTTLDIGGENMSPEV